MGHEKRKYLRFECLVPVDLLKIESAGLVAKDALIKEISREGFRMILDVGSHFQPGKTVDFKILNSDKHRTISVLGEVMWAKPKGDKLEVGIKIREMDSASKSELLDIGYSHWREAQTKIRRKKKP